VTNIDPADIELPPTRPIDMTPLIRDMLDASRTAVV